MKPSDIPTLPKPVVIPCTMELAGENKERINLETFGMTYEKVNL
jgi:hypothetical protein